MAYNLIIEESTFNIPYSDESACICEVRVQEIENILNGWFCLEHGETSAAEHWSREFMKDFREWYYGPQPDC